MIKATERDDAFRSAFANFLSADVTKEGAIMIIEGYTKWLEQVTRATAMRRRIEDRED